MEIFTEVLTPDLTPRTRVPADAFARPAPASPKIDQQERTRLATISRQASFLDAFSRHGILGQAAKQAGVSRQAVWQWEQQDEAFAMLKRQAFEDAKDAVEYALHLRAVDGVERKDTRRYSDVLLLARVKALKPQVYDRQPERGAAVVVTQTNNLVVPLERLSDEQFKLLEQVYGQAGPQIIEMPKPQIADGNGE